MKKLMGSAALLAAVVCSEASAQAADATAPIPFRATAKVWIDETGHPSQVEATSGLPLAVRTSIEQEVSKWRFQSPVVDGIPRGGITYVSLGACGVPEADGSLRLALNYTGNGPGYADDAVMLPPPRYPTDMARKGQGGEWSVEYMVEPDGSATFVSIVGSKPNQPSLRHIEPTLREWVKSMRHVPEQIDGAPVRTRVATPVTFSMARSSSRKVLMQEMKRELESSPECSAVMEKSAGERPVALDSPFRRLDAG